MNPRPGPGDLTIVAVALLAIAGYALAASSETPGSALVLVAVVCLAVLVVGIVAPVIALRDVTVEARVPPDANSGDLIAVDCAFGGRCRSLEVRTLDPPGRWMRAIAPGSGALEHVAARRGVFSALRLELRTAAPLGVFQRRRMVVVPLPVVIHVGPRPAAVPPHPPRDQVQGEGVDTHRSALGGERFRSVREYQPGDALRLVHWPTTARSGRLVVRELDPPVHEAVAILVDLDPTPAEAEATASHAAGLALQALAEGNRVMLLTRERGGPVAGEAHGALDVARRLARAVPGPPAESPPGWPYQVRA